MAGQLRVDEITDEAGTGSPSFPNGVAATSATNLTGTGTGSIVTTALGSGTADSTTFLRGDRTFATVPAAAPSTAQVLSATAGASVDAVGTYAFLMPANNVVYQAGATLAGSTLRYASTRSDFNLDGQFNVSGTPSGTWRLMGFRSSTANTNGSASLWLRIS